MVSNGAVAEIKVQHNCCNQQWIRVEEGDAMDIESRITAIEYNKYKALLSASKTLRCGENFSGGSSLLKVLNVSGGIVQ